MHEWSTNYNLGRSGGDRLGVPITGDTLKDLNNFAAFDQGAAAAKSSSSTTSNLSYSGSGSGSGADGLFYAVESGFLAWWLLSQPPVIDRWRGGAGDGCRRIFAGSMI